MAIVDLEQVTKVYPRHPGNRILLGKGGLFTMLSRKHDRTPRPALDQVSASIDLGECVGLAGACGAGKSTLLRLIGGITGPTSGRITVLGRVASVLDSAGAFHPHLSGRDNIRLLARFSGLKRRDADELPALAAEFAEMEAALDEPVASYSNSMCLRLAFASAVHVGADILLFDDILATMDLDFQPKCLATIRTLREQGKTFIIVTNPAFPGIVEVCDRVLTLEGGKFAGFAPGPGEPASESVEPPEPSVSFEEPELSAESTAEDETQQIVLESALESAENIEAEESEGLKLESEDDPK